MSNSQITGIYWVPGLPHVLMPEYNQSYRNLHDAMVAVGDDIASKETDRIVYYSTQWLSVLGTSFQAKAQLQGYHVDENWHELKDLPFDFRVDQGLANSFCNAAKAAGFPTATVDFAGFPVDTGTIVADTLINPKKLPTSMVSCHVYLDYDQTTRLAESLATTLNQGPQRTAVVIVSLLSGNYFTHEIDLREDHIRDQSNEVANESLLKSLSDGTFPQWKTNLPDYCKQNRADMGLKGLAFAEGFAKGNGNEPSTVYAYGPIYGTGASVMQLFGN